MDYSIIRYNEKILSLLPEKQEPFEIIGRLIPIYNGQQWKISENIFEKPTYKTYPNEIYEPREYIDNPNQAAFVALYNNEWVGSIRICRRWNNNAFIDDLSVGRQFRGKGIGTKLMNAAVNWSRENNLYGVSLETQDMNLLACRFYIKYGFMLGGIDRLVYTAEDYIKETALYFYLLPTYK
ncbi:MAG: GNAT family N-acetyltransferase [Oscillospiraceae bacterium]|jgi:ribosomal protein S18 acetylase RimI-like enzyme|nr:GNAT family N-acetyltransferase [Oscillospiraceae bacterium]